MDHITTDMRKNSICPITHTPRLSLFPCYPESLLHLPTWSTVTPEDLMRACTIKVLPYNFEHKLYQEGQTTNRITVNILQLGATLAVAAVSVASIAAAEPIAVEPIAASAASVEAGSSAAVESVGTAAAGSAKAGDAVAEAGGPVAEAGGLLADAGDAGDAVADAGNCMDPWLVRVDVVRGAVMGGIM
jgi:hypothetical protein